jgi:hypothetical protein
MFAVLGALSTPLAAQSAGTKGGDAIGLGFVATLGGGWQIETGEVGYVHRLRRGPLGAVSGGIRMGSFIDEGAILGGARGFVVAGTLGARTARLSVAQLGDDQNVTSIGFDVTLEASGYLTSNSPLPQGSRWGAVTLLPGLRVGGLDGPQYSILIGPTAFLGSKTDVRGMLAFRIEAPLARREPHP